jgi:hypothetical protein
MKTFQSNKFVSLYNMLNIKETLLNRLDNGKKTPNYLASDTLNPEFLCKQKIASKRSESPCFLILRQQSIKILI